MRSHSPSSRFASAFHTKTPALFTTMSRRPVASRVLSTSASTAVFDVTSVAIASAFPPAPSISLLVRSISSAERDATATVAPARARTREIARPRPRPAPVTMAVSPSRTRRRAASLPAPVRGRVMTPPSYEASLTRRFPVLYFLHDGRGSEDVFFREGLADALEKDMREGSLPEMLVVAPRGVGTWFVDSQGGVSRYATFLTRTLVPFVDARYRTVASRGSRLVAGISMGGYGALRWALAEPDL